MLRDERRRRKKRRLQLQKHRPPNGNELGISFMEKYTLLLPFIVADVNQRIFGVRFKSKSTNLIKTQAYQILVWMVFLLFLPCHLLFLINNHHYRSILFMSLILLFIPAIIFNHLTLPSVNATAAICTFSPILPIQCAHHVLAFVAKCALNWQRSLLTERLLVNGANCSVLLNWLVCKIRTFGNLF